MTIVLASFIVFDIPISPTFKEDNFLTESSWLYCIEMSKYVDAEPVIAFLSVSLTNRQQYYGIFLEVIPVDSSGHQTGTAIGYFDPPPSNYGVKLLK